MLLPPVSSTAADAGGGVLDTDTWFHGGRCRALTCLCALPLAAASCRLLSGKIKLISCTLAAAHPPQVVVHLHPNRVRAAADGCGGQDPRQRPARHLAARIWATIGDG